MGNNEATSAAATRSTIDSCKREHSNSPECIQTLRLCCLFHAGLLTTFLHLLPENSVYICQETYSVRNVKRTKLALFHQTEQWHYLIQRHCSINNATVVIQMSL